MKTLTHIPQQPDITDEFIGCYDATGKEGTTRWQMRYEAIAGVGDVRHIFRPIDLKTGLSGWYDRKDCLVNSAIKHGFTALSFDSQAELDAWLKEGK